MADETSPREGAVTRDASADTVAPQPDAGRSPSRLRPRVSSPLAPALTGPDVGTGDPTDGRLPYQWESRYPEEANTHIRWEAFYVVAVLLASLLLIFFSWKGAVSELLGLSGDAASTLRKYAIYTSSGLLGGAVFGIKYLYRVVARGYWHLDRKLWRYCSPLNSFSVALVIGACLEASILSSPAASSSRAALVFGFIAGYFADQAISKLHEIATVVFGTATTTAKAEERPKD